MGEVYIAYDTVKDRTVALKLLPTDLADDPEYQERFRREARTAARLQEPHVIPIHDFGAIDGVLFIDMRLVRGRDLRSVLRSERRLDPARAIAVVSQVAAALDAAHADGLVHRDVKPENVLLTQDDFAYLADFGIASRADESKLTGDGSAIGSFAYMAPERFDDAPVTSSADVYSLGCLLHECLTGATPFAARTVSAQIRAHLYETPPALSVIAPDVPAGLDRVLQWALAKDPASRPQTAGDLARAASAALDPRSSPVERARTDPMPPPVAAPRSSSATETPTAGRSRRGVAVLALVAVAAVVAGVLALRPLLSDDGNGAQSGATGVTLTSDDGVSASPSATPTSAATSGPTPEPTSSTPSTTTPMPSPSTEPGTTNVPSQRTGVGLSGPGYDFQGWVSPQDARCNVDDPAVLVAASTTTRIAICETAVGDYYYRGYSTKSGNGIEIDHPERTASGWQVTNDGVTYDISRTDLSIRKGSNSLLDEPMTTYADGT
ncbi:hypothetical protein VV01_07965 [Luteipulveratus halotolerans]|uniref:non-specific serine/threonine protein kinase n=2 Tax=Luteipulveratus halotolerans TaxID=1631356 RepID=A0A0L6CH15_9MICO|nr:hypothetical protein VV01_07965 [Luteipulveratus halotolerans]